MIGDECRCPYGKENINGICKSTCIGGKLINDKCECPEEK